MKHGCLKYMIVTAVFLLLPFTASAQNMFTALEEEGFRGKCLTPLLAEDDGFFAAKVAAHVDREKSVVSSGGHFRVHYDTSSYHAPDQTDNDRNGIPDYVDSTMVYLEYAWDLEVNELGFNEPPSDYGLGGGDEIDCYITNFGAVTGTYGMAYPDTGNVLLNKPVSAHIYIDNDFAESVYPTHGYDALKITTAHEFFHVVQFGYIYTRTILWWAEQTAVWMEQRAWPDIEDYFTYIDDFMLYPDISLSNSIGNFEYGAGIWPMYLSKTYGDDIIRSTWERYAQGDNSSISALNDVIPNGLAEAYNEFACWNFFTKDRANTEAFYLDGDRFPYSAPISWQSLNRPWEKDFSDINFMTSKYIELVLDEDYGNGFGVTVEVTPSTSATKLASSVILYNNPGDYRIQSLSNNKDVVPFGRNWEKIILVVSNTNFYGDSFGFSYIADITTASDVEETPEVFAIGNASPNPFNPSTSIAFTLPENGHVSATVYNTAGQKVDTLIDREMTAGAKRLFWKPGNISGGVYFIRVATEQGVKTAKALFLK